MAVLELFPKQKEYEYGGEQLTIEQSLSFFVNYPFYDYEGFVSRKEEEGNLEFEKIMLNNGPAIMSNQLIGSDKSIGIYWKKGDYFFQIKYASYGVEEGKALQPTELLKIAESMSP